MNSAIIPAAGAGKRFASDVPKQFLEVNGRPLIIHTLEQFEGCIDIDEIVLVLPRDSIAEFELIIGKYGISKLTSVVAGGSTRAESVLRGLESVTVSEGGIVAVHDGARPLVKADEISKCIRGAMTTGAAILVAPVTDTIKMVSSEGVILETIDRAKLRRALTPQCFRLEVLRRAFENADLSDSATDESFLVEKLGVEVLAVEGSSTNIKVTMPEDLILVGSLMLEERQK